jgi:hypothetical protein
MKDQRRIEERIAFVALKVCLNTEDGRIMDCDLLDVSASGARLQVPPGTKRCKGGEIITLQTATLPLGSLFNNRQALVIWADEQQLGMRLKFPLALPDEELGKLLVCYRNK